MAIQPGNPDVIAVSLQSSEVGDIHEHTAIFDNGEKRPSVTPPLSWVTELVFGDDPTRLYGFNSVTTGKHFYTLDVTEAGLTITSVNEDLLEGFGQEMQYVDGKIYTRSRIIDPVAEEILGSFSIDGGFSKYIVDTTLDRIYFLAFDSQLTSTPFSSQSIIPRLN